MALALHRSPAADDAEHVHRLRVRMADGAETTLHVALHPRAQTTLEIVRLPRPRPLVAHCAEHGIQEALVGGFFVRRDGVSTDPLGELRTRGVRRRSVPFDAPWGDLRACVHSLGGEVTIARRPELPAAPAGDLLQAGPLLVRDGAVVDGDVEGFSAGQRQFDSDITAGRYPRAALGLTRDHLVAVACDGRADDEAGLTMVELAHAMRELGCDSAMNLDGGGSTSLVSEGRLRNVPREIHGVPLAGGRAVVTAVVFRRHSPPGR
jgi:hypothetical protein